MRADDEVYNSCSDGCLLYDIVRVWLCKFIHVDVLIMATASSLNVEIPLSTRLQSIDVQSTFLGEHFSMDSNFDSSQAS